MFFFQASEKGTDFFLSCLLMVSLQMHPDHQAIGLEGPTGSVCRHT
jgi:hypothetical protein